jgi:hypothetical protein
MAKRTGEINPNEYSLIWGTHQVKGFHEGDVITIVYDANSYNYLTGADEEAARINLVNNTVLITFLLMQTSLSNDYLSVAANIDSKTGGGAAQLLFKDNWGNTVGASPVSWIEKRPDQAFQGGQGASIPSRSWAIRCPHYEGIIGSSRRVSAA